MLSLANISAAHGANYFKVENYYTEKDSVVYSRWTGSDSAKLGLSGAVDHNQFSQLLKGTDPNIQVAGDLNNRKRAGLDMTFSAPKSVSIQALVFGDNRLVEAHRAAVSEALGYAEKHFSAYRAGGRNDRTVHKGTGLIIAQFEHDSSRLKDPQLHTHNVVFNRVENENGEVRALHGDLIFRNSVFLGMIYQNSLAKKARELGYSIRLNAKGSFEIEGFSKEQLAVFSKRKEQIDSMEPESYRESRDLVLKNRKAKEGPQQREFLLERWEKEAQDKGIQAISQIKNIKYPLQRQDSRQSETVLTKAVSSVASKSSVFKKEDALKEALQISLGQFSISVLENTFDKRNNGAILPTIRKEFFTTKESVERDLQIRHSVEEGVGTALPIAIDRDVTRRIENTARVDRLGAEESIRKLTELFASNATQNEKLNKIVQSLEASLDKDKRLSISEITSIRSNINDLIQSDWKQKNPSECKKILNELMNPIQKSFLAPTSGQREAIEKTLLSRDQYMIWQGVAGAGKTYALKQIVEEAGRHGIEVKGFAPSAAAALLLAKETGIETDTLQGHILRRTQQESSKSLWIVDEAGMMSAKDFRKLQVKAQVHGARVLLVGDHRQLSPVDAGNPFLDIQRHTSTTLVHLNESLRQKEALLQVAVAHMNRGNVAEGVRALGAHVREVKTGRGRKNLVAREFAKLSESGSADTLLLARTNRIREDLTAEIRLNLKKQGLLKNEVMVPVFRKLDASRERLAVSSTYSAGDIIVPNRNYKHLRLSKDTPYEVVATNGPKNTVSVNSGSEIVELALSQHNNVSLFSKGFLPLAEGDKMIWSRNVKSRGQLNNSGFVVEKISSQGVHIRANDGQMRILDPKIPQHMEHAWALTTYKAQGQTASNVLQIVDPGSTARDLLVGVTRAAHDVMLVAENRDVLLKSAAFVTQKPIAAEEVASSQVEMLHGRAKSRGVSR